MSEDLYHNAVNESRARGERLRRIRNLANLSRKELCDESGTNINTYIGYEVGRYGGLTKNGAIKIIEYIASKGVYCSFEWLMHGVGQAPCVVTDNQQNYFQDKHDISNEKQCISEEIFLFRKHYNNSIDYRIIDDGMLPIYSIDDYVAGVCYTPDSINDLIGSNCIVQIANGDIVVRNLRQGKEENYYTLSCINPETSVHHPILYDVKLIFAAKIIWHRKIYLNESKKKNNEKYTNNVT
jgi:transcriptional regulator with XRE-family HTH domain